MKKSISILLTAILLCLAFSGCSSKAQNNLSRAIDNAGQGLDDSANRFRQNATRGWDNGTNTTAVWVNITATIMAATDTRQTNIMVTTAAIRGIMDQAILTITHV